MAGICFPNITLKQNVSHIYSEFKVRLSLQVLPYSQVSPAPVQGPAATRWTPTCVRAARCKGIVRGTGDGAPLSPAAVSYGASGV